MRLRTLFQAATIIVAFGGALAQEDSHPKAGFERRGADERREVDKGAEDRQPLKPAEAGRNRYLGAHSGETFSDAKTIREKLERQKVETSSTDKTFNNGDITKLSDARLKEIVKRLDYDNVHRFKADYHLNDTNDVGIDKRGNLYSTSRIKGGSGYEPLHINGGR